jgi:hypothetical protein
MEALAAHLVMTDGLVLSAVAVTPDNKVFDRSNRTPLLRDHPPASPSVMAVTMAMAMTVTMAVTMVPVVTMMAVVTVMVAVMSPPVMTVTEVKVDMAVAMTTMPDLLDLAAG